MEGSEKLGSEHGEAPLQPQDESRSRGVKQVDQSGGETPSQESDTTRSGGSEERQPFAGGQALMEQWLEQIEGDPAQLMRQEFRLEEYKYLRNHRGQEQETRPW